MLFTDSVGKTKLHRSKSNITIAKSGYYQKLSPKGPLSTVATSFSTSGPIFLKADTGIHIEAKFYISHLTQIHYYGNKILPREIFKMIATIIRFHPNLSNITINHGLDVYGLYEICKLLNVSQITEICLGYLDIKNAHFHLLLVEATNLNYLSLSRCTIKDEIVENIMSQLKYPSPASKKLIALNLSCNLITDNGVHFIGKALRSNRCLQYLNLAGNMITDDGATLLFDSLMKFPLTNNEEDERNKSYVQYCTKKVSLMTQFYTESTSHHDKIKTGSKLVRKIHKKSKKADEVSLNAENNTVDATDFTEHHKASAFAENILGQFSHPFDNNNAIREDGIRYCLGNNTLCCLNLAYNNLMLNSIRKLCHILAYQKISFSERTPKGLTRVVIEGNPLPASCAELQDLNYVLESVLNVGQKNRVAAKKSKPTKTYRLKDSL